MEHPIGAPDSAANLLYNTRDKRSNFSQNHYTFLCYTQLVTTQGVQGDASPEALAWGVPHRRQLKGFTLPQGGAGVLPCRGLGCPKTPFSLLIYKYAIKLLPKVSHLWPL